MKATKKPFYKKWWFWSIIVVLAIIGYFTDDSEAQPTKETAAVADKSEKQPAKEAPKEKAEPEVKKDVEKPKDESKAEKAPREESRAVKTPEDIVKKVIEKDRIIEINKNDQNGHLLVRFKGSENLTNEMTVKGFLMDIRDLLKNLKSDSSVQTFAFNVTYPLVDNYGNESEDIVIKAEFSRETVDKINFDNFDFNKITEVADEYWSHPAVQQ